MLDSTAQPRTSAILFNGTGMEYFRIWIVNIALSIITLGIYSAWAKVRTLQYFYGNTQVLGQSFQYHATGGQILRSRIIAVLIFFAYQLVVTLFPLVAIVLAVGFLFLVPWLVNAGMRFNARMTSWRNVRFDFKGSYGRAMVVYYLWPILGLLSFGILMPTAVQRAEQFVVDNHRYGEEAFKFTATTATYRPVIWGLMITYLITFIVLALGISQVNFVFISIGYLAIYLVSFCIKPLLFNVYWNHVTLKGNGFEADMAVGRFIWILFSNSIAVALTLGLLYPWSKVRLAQFTANAMSTVDVGSVSQIVAAQQTTASAFGEELGDVFDVDVGFGV